MLNYNFKLFFLLALLACKTLHAQNVHVNWSNFYTENTGYPINWIESDNKVYFLIDDSRFDHKPIIKLARFDKNLNLEKIVIVPSKYNDEKIIYDGLIVSGDELVLNGKYMETKGTNKYVMIKANANKNLMNPINFEKVTDVEIRSYFDQTFHEEKSWIDGNKILIKTIPKEGLKDKSIFKYEIFDNKLANKEWSVDIDLTHFMKDFIIVTNTFTNNREFIFLLRSRHKFLKGNKEEFIFGKFTKEKGMEIMKFNFEKDTYTLGSDLIVDQDRNVAYVRNSFSSIPSKRNQFNIKKIDITNFQEIYNKIIDFGPSSSKCFEGTLGFLGPTYTFDQYNLKKVIIDKNTGNLELIGQLIEPFRLSTYRDKNNNLCYSQTKGANGNIVILKIDSMGNYVTTVIPHEVKTTSYSEAYSTFYLTEYKEKECFLIYDNDKNAANTFCTENIETKYIMDNDNNELYMILINKNNQIEKIKPAKTFKGEGKRYKKYLNFELDKIHTLSNNRYLVFHENLFGILTIE